MKFFFKYCTGIHIETSEGQSYGRPNCLPPNADNSINLFMQNPRTFQDG